MGDIKIAYVPVLISGGVMAFFTAMLWVIMLRSCPALIAWLSILFAFTSLLVSTIIVGTNANLVHHESLDKNASDSVVQVDTADLKYYQGMTIVLALLTTTLLLTVVFLYTRIKLCIGILRETAKCVQHIPSLLMFPIVPAASLFLLLAYFIASSAYIGSSDTITVQNIKETTGVKSVTMNEPNNIMWFPLRLMYLGFFGLSSC